MKRLRETSKNFSFLEVSKKAYRETPIFKKTKHFSDGNSVRVTLKLLLKS